MSTSCAQGVLRSTAACQNRMELLSSSSYHGALQTACLREHLLCHSLPPVNLPHDNDRECCCPKVRWQGRTARAIVRVPASGCWQRHKGVRRQLLPRQRDHHGMHGRFQLLQVPRRLQCICHETSDDTTEFGHHMVDEVDSTAPVTTMMSASPILTSSPVVKAYTFLSCRTVR